MIHDFTHFEGAWRGDSNPVSGLERLSIPRMTFLKTSLKRIVRPQKQHAHSIKGLRVLDVGCGGGLVSESLCALGAEVVAVDANKEALAHVQKHIPTTVDAGSVRTICADVYDVDQHCSRNAFDAIVCLEVLEHVDNPSRLLALLEPLLRPGGCLIVSTLNRTLQSLFLGIICAEYVLGWAPRGCHDFRAFIKPKEMASWIRMAKLTPESAQGISWSYTQGGFALSSNDSVNYMMAAWKK